MLYYLSELSDLFSPLRIFQYITFRAFAGAGTAFLISVAVGPRVIQLLKQLKIGQQDRHGDAAVLQSMHGKKAGTPTMGGVLIIGSVLLSVLLWANPFNLQVLLVAGTMLAMGAVGFLDDFLKIRKKGSRGLPAIWKIGLQSCWVILVVMVMWNSPLLNEHARQLMIPFMKDPLLSGLCAGYVVVFVWGVLVGASNAVNLTDGLDGLAIGCSNSVAVAYLAMSYVAGHVVFADYLQVPYIEGSGELAVFCACLLGGGLGFLWFNCHPAKVFMGDTGSLAIGGTIAMVAVLIKQEIALLIVGGVFTIEALSVMIQVSYFKISGGKRVFKCAPLHHHYEIIEKERAEKAGRDLEVVETMITTRFWILSIISALIGVATLKIR